MASSLSEEEFHRMQLQLLELRTTNYELDGKVKKQERELESNRVKIENLDKDLQRTNKAIQKSKKAKEVELLIQENDQLQRKLLSQEEEFRLQNQTLMQELSSVIATSEQYEKELTALKEGKSDSSNESPSSSSQYDDEVRRLQAQNSALQKNFTASQEKYEKQISNLAEQLQKLTCTKDDTEKEKSENTEENPENDELSGENQESSTEEKKILSEDVTKEMTELRLSLDTELEEKRLLKEQLADLEKSYKEKNVSIQEELDKVSDKLKKKQESYLQLTVEKETLFKESNAKQEELQAGRDRDKKYYMDQINKLQQELEHSKQVLKQTEESSSSKLKQLESQTSSLQQQVDAANIVENQHLKEQTAKFQQQIRQLEVQLLSLTQNRDDLSVQLQACKTANQESLEQLNAVHQERENSIREWQEVNKVAEKRKAMLDDLANTYQRDNAAYQEKVRLMQEEHDAENQELRNELEVEQKRRSELEKDRQHLDETKKQMQSLDEAKGWLERRLKEVEDSLEAEKEGNVKSIDSLKTEHESLVTSLKEEHESEVSNLQQELEEKIQMCHKTEESLKEELANTQKEIVRLKQEIKDTVDERKIHEKKGKTMMKDLKRQLHSERKRAEKLQDKLQEILSENKHNRSMEELFAMHDGNDSLDRSSISSWSAGASLVRESSILSSPQSPERPFSPPSSDLEQEHGELLARITDLQQKNWNLEEQVSHLETSTSAMAEDLLQKTKIIEHYVMEQRIDAKSHLVPHEEKLTLKKVLDLVNKNDDQNLKDMNKKLQNMLEETLTKNMHLQKDLEVMSQEIVRLSKIQHTPNHDKAKEQSREAAAAGIS